MWRLLSLTIYCLLCFVSQAQVRDSIFLFNGQELIGDLKSVKLGVVTIDDKDLKIQNIKLYKVKRLHAAQSIFRVETIYKSVYFSTIEPSDHAGYIVIHVNGEAREIAYREIAIILPLQKGFFKRLDGNLGLGFSYSKSSAIGQLSMNSLVSYVARKTEYQLSASSLYSIDSASFSRDNESVQLFVSYSLQKAWFLAGQANYQRNLELSIARRYQELIGAGNKLVLKPSWQLWLLSGLNLTQERSTEGNSTVQLEVPVMMRLNFFKYQEVNVQVYFTQTAYFSLTQTGRVRDDATLSVAYELIHNFNISINFYTNFDNQPPVNTSNKIDFGTTFNVAYKF